MEKWGGSQMEKWEYKVLHGLSEDELNTWGEKGYEVYSIISPPAPGPLYQSPQQRDAETTVTLKPRKP